MSEDFAEQSEALRGIDPEPRTNGLNRRDESDESVIRSVHSAAETNALRRFCPCAALVIG